MIEICSQLHVMFVSRVCSGDEEGLQDCVPIGRYSGGGI